MRDDVAECLFSLFSTSDRAIAMAGDLAEERDQRGWIWFWVQVMRVTLALWSGAVTEAPLRVLALMLAGTALLTTSALGGAAAVFLFPLSMNSLVGWIPLPFFWWGGAFGTGAFLVTLAPRHGTAACATLAVTIEALLVGASGPAVWHSSNAVFAFLCTTSLLAAMPLLAGAAVARRRLAYPVLAKDQHR